MVKLRHELVKILVAFLCLQVGHARWLGKDLSAEASAQLSAVVSAQQSDLLKFAVKYWVKDTRFWWARESVGF